MLFWSRTVVLVTDMGEEYARYALQAFWVSFMHNKGMLSVPFSVRARLSVSYMSHLLLNVGTAMETHNTFDTSYFPRVTYLCIDATYRGAIHYYTILTLSGFP
jgi:hypothetical protein